MSKIIIDALEQRIKELENQLHYFNVFVAGMFFKLNLTEYKVFQKDMDNLRKHHQDLENSKCKGHALKTGITDDGEEYIEIAEVSLEEGNHECEDHGHH